MAPFVAALLKGGLSLLANAGLNYGKEWIEKETGIKIDGNTLTSEQQILLRQYELDHEEKLAQLALESNKLAKSFEEMYLQDTQNARQMQVAALAQEDKFSKRFVYYLAAGVIVLCALYIGFITFTEIPPENQRFADTILGAVLTTFLGAIFQFFFGSSKNAQYNENIVDAVVTSAVKKGTEE